MVQLLRRSQILSLDRIKKTEPVLRLINVLPRAFPNLLGLRLEYIDRAYETFMAIPESILGRLTELGLAVSSEREPSDDSNDRFLQVARHMVSQTRQLKYLRVAPHSPPASWIELFAENAPVLAKLEELVIGGSSPIDESKKRLSYLNYSKDVFLEALANYNSDKVREAISPLPVQVRADFYSFER